MPLRLNKHSIVIIRSGAHYPSGRKNVPLIKFEFTDNPDYPLFVTSFDEYGRPYHNENITNKNFVNFLIQMNAKATLTQ